MIDLILMLVMSGTPLTPVRASVVPLRAAVSHGRWLARCSAVPVRAVDGTTIMGVSVAREAAPATARTADKLTVVQAYRRPGARAWWLRKGKHRGVLVCYRVATYKRMGVYACHGPTVLRDLMAADPACPNVVAWPKVRDLPTAALTAVASGLICCGASSVGPAWQCSRSAALGGNVTVTRLDGYGPAVVAGGSPCSDYQTEK